MSVREIGCVVEKICCSPKCHNITDSGNIVPTDMLLQRHVAVSCTDNNNEIYLPTTVEETNVEVQNKSTFLQNIYNDTTISTNSVDTLSESNEMSVHCGKKQPIPTISIPNDEKVYVDAELKSSCLNMTILDFTLGKINNNKPMYFEDLTISDSENENSSSEKFDLLHLSLPISKLSDKEMFSDSTESYELSTDTSDESLGNSLNFSTVPDVNASSSDSCNKKFNLNDSHILDNYESSCSDETDFSSTSSDQSILSFSDVSQDSDESWSSSEESVDMDDWSSSDDTTNLNLADSHSDISENESFVCSDISADSELDTSRQNLVENDLSESWTDCSESLDLSDEEKGSNAFDSKANCNKQLCDSNILSFTENAEKPSDLNNHCSKHLKSTNV